jgi:phenylacetate-CoA ligase
MFGRVAAGEDETLDGWTAQRMAVAAPLTRAAIEAYQLAQIRETVAFARGASPFYRSWTDWPDIVLESLADVTQLPFTRPADLLRNAPTLGAVSQREIARIVTLGTSGTSGPPKRIYFTAEDLEATLDFFHNGMALFTRSADRVLIAFPGERPGSVGEALARAVERLGAVPIIAPPDQQIEAFVTLLRAVRPAVVFGPPVRLLAAARVSACDGGPRIAIRAALVSSDNIPQALRRHLSVLWGCEVFAHWGMTETGFGGALDCRLHTGQHLRESDLYVEVVDAATGASLPSGETGEIVITTLRQRGTPLIRYRTGDLGHVDTAPCGCGSVLRRLGGPQRRIGAAVELPGGGTISLPMLDELLFGISAVTDFTAELDEAVPMRLTLTVATPLALREPGVCESVRHQLTNDPVIGAALLSGALQLTVRLAETSTCQHAGKRRLVRGTDVRRGPEADGRGDGEIAHDRGFDTVGALTRSKPEPSWPKAVLFDLDGTLINSAGDVHEALNETLAHFGIPPLDLETAKRIIGGGASRLIGRAFAMCGRDLDLVARDEIVNRFLANYRPRATKLTTLCPGAAEVALMLARGGTKLAVVTNKGEKETMAVLARFALSELIDVVIGGDAGPPKKPDPGLIHLACKRLGIEASDAVFVGDSEYDVDAARAAQMTAIAVRGGCTGRGVDNLGAARVIDNLNDLPRLLRLLRDSR